MSFQPPRDESLNGLLQGYRIYYRELESETGMGPETKTLKSPSALRAELTGEPYVSVCSLEDLLGNTIGKPGEGKVGEQAL